MPVAVLGRCRSDAVDDDAGEVKPQVRVADHRHGVQRLLGTLQREQAGFGDDQTEVARGERVAGQLAERGGGVDQHEVVARPGPAW